MFKSLVLIVDCYIVCEWVKNINNVIFNENKENYFNESDKLSICKGRSSCVYLLE